MAEPGQANATTGFTGVILVQGEFTTMGKGPLSELVPSLWPFSPYFQRFHSFCLGIACFPRFLWEDGCCNSEEKAAHLADPSGEVNLFVRI
jgi:hypothetical protein